VSTERGGPLRGRSWLSRKEKKISGSEKNKKKEVRLIGGEANVEGGLYFIKRFGIQERGGGRSEEKL